MAHAGSSWRAARPRVGGMKATTSAGPIRLSSPTDVVVYLPYALGYVPDHSLAVLSVPTPDEPTQPRGARPGAFRVDLPDPDATGKELDDWAGVVAWSLANLGVHKVMTTYWTPDHEAARRLSDRLDGPMTRSGIRVAEALRVDAGRWWSLTCSAACCPAAGTPYDASGSAVAAALTLAGRQVLPSRSAMAALLDPVGGAARQEMTAAHAQVNRELALRTGVAGLSQWMARDAARRVKAALRAGGQVPDNLDVAWLATHVAHIPIRDRAWASMRQGALDAHRELWGELVRRAAPELAVAPACLFAFAAWLDGEGAMARIAVDRALAQDPSYSMGLLLEEALDRALPPSVWRSGADDVASADDVAGEVA